MTKKGFTLIELMIVIAILGILAAIVVPTFIAYKRQREAKIQQQQTVAPAPSVESSAPAYEVEEDKSKEGSNKL